jgi:hypothetical protein
MTDMMMMMMMMMNMTLCNAYLGTLKILVASKDIFHELTWSIRQAF